MIITVTMNPAIDKTAEVETLNLGGLNRLKNVVMDAGGKGINVSKTIQALGGTTLCTGFLAGSSGDYIRSSLEKRTIACDFIEVKGMTRTNLKVLDQNMELTELNEAGPEIQAQELDELMARILKKCDSDTIVVLSGNVAPSVQPTIYKTMIEKFKRVGATTILDADGELFRYGIEARPTITKPNKYELATYFNVAQTASNEEIVALAKQLLNEDTKLVVVSMGKEGSIFITSDAVYQIDALDIQAHSSVGAGDAMVAGIAYAVQEKTSMEELIRLAVGASAGAVMTKGTQPASIEVVEQLKKQVNIKLMEEIK